MRTLRALLLASALAVTAACSFLLDFNSLEGNPTGDASVAGGKAGTGGTTTGGTGAGGAGGSLAGAGGSAGSAADADTGILLADLAGAVADALCKNLDACYVSLIEIVTRGNDCKTYFEDHFHDTFVALIEASVKNGDLTYDPVKAEQCVAEVNPSGTCVDPTKAIEGCKVALGGLKTEGSPCKHTFECVEGSLCDTRNGCGAAKCVKYQQLNQPCTDSSQCAKGLTCSKPNPEAGARTCQKFTVVNTPCDDKSPDCEPGTFCVGQVCQKITGLFVLANDAPCYGNNLLCAAGGACEFNFLPFVGNGKCVADKAHLNCSVAIPDSCGAGNYCDAWVNSGNCSPLPGADLACVNRLEQWIGLAPDCAPGNVCVDGLCRQFAKLDAPCYGNAQCDSSFCQGANADAGTQGTCKPPACL